MKKNKSILIISGLFFVAVVVSYLLNKKDNGVEKLSEGLSLIEKTSFLNLHDSVEYVGTESCRKCHEDMYKAYMQTGMGMSWGNANNNKSALAGHGKMLLFDENKNLYYQPFWQNNQLMLKEFRLEGEDTVFIRTEKIGFIVGSGQHTNSHLIWINGYLYQAPFTFYTQKKLLDFPPGFENNNNSRFSRQIGAECISCHNSYPKQIAGSINKYSEIPLGINCERCHGPGELHVKAMEKGFTVNTNTEADYTIVNPKRLPRQLADELCARCHNQGNSVLKKGRTFYDFKPGMEVSSVLDVFREVYENDDDAFWMETHPERLKKSKCWQSTQNHPDFKPLACIDCHFTSGMKHVSFRQTPTDTFRQKCINCHQKPYVECKENLASRNAQQDNCMTCHLIKTGVFDIPHVVISDHYIRVSDKWKKEIKSTSAIESGNFLGLKCMSSDKADKYTLAKAFLFHYEKFRSMPSLLDSAYFYLKNIDKVDGFTSWIYYYYLKNNFDKVVEFSEKNEKNADKDAVCYYQIGQSYYNLNKTETAIEYYKKAVKAEPYNLDYRNKLGTAYLTLNKPDKAILEFQFIIAENPQHSQAYNNLGFALMLQNDLKNAEKQFYQALKYEPDYLNAQLNLVKIYIAQGRLMLARSYLEKLKIKHPAEKTIHEMESLLR